MLKAILQGKAGRVTLDGGIDHSWKEVFRQREDLLTSVFFSRIPYLSKVGQDRVLEMLIGKGITQPIGSINELLFWPKLPSAKGRRYVEPDVMIECDHCTVLIEVKPPMGGAQDLIQWRHEIESLRRLRKAEKITENSAVHFVALGRNSKDWTNWKRELEADYEEMNLSVQAIEWSSIANYITQAKASAQGADFAIYTDWIAAFNLYGIVPLPLPFDDLLPYLNIIPDNWRNGFNRFVPPVTAITRKSRIVWHDLLPLTTQTAMRLDLWN